MLTPDQLKPFLRHEDRFIRRAATDHFADSGSCDPELIPMILDACERFGFKSNLRGLSVCRHLAVTQETLDRILRHLTEAGDADWIDQLN